MDALKRNMTTTCTKGKMGRGFNVYTHPTYIEIKKLMTFEREFYLTRWFSQKPKSKFKWN